MSRYDTNTLYSNVSAVADHLIQLTETAFSNPGDGSVKQIANDLIDNYASATLECRDILDIWIFRYPIRELESEKESSLAEHDDFEDTARVALDTLDQYKQLVNQTAHLMSSTFKRIIDITNEYVEFKQHSDIYSEVLSGKVHSAVAVLKSKYKTTYDI